MNLLWFFKSKDECVTFPCQDLALHSYGHHAELSS